MRGEVREFEFTEADFERLARVVRASSGISLSPTKFDLVYSRLAKRVREHGLSSFSHYADLIESGDAAELSELANAMTTNVTGFFRESYHFDSLQEDVLSPLLEDGPDGQRIRIWSAACSSGEEPYSIALSALANWRDLAKADFRVLATDLDSQMVAHGQAGVYEESSLEPLEPEWRRQFFARGRGDNAGFYRVKSDVSRFVTFKTLNLMDDWPINGPFDAIFCRNVMIYFDEETRQSLVERFRQLLKPGGLLYIGHSETLPTGSDGFQFLKRTTYRRVN